MRKQIARAIIAMIGMLMSICVAAQTTASVEPAVRNGADPGGIGRGIKVPRLIKFSGAFQTPSGTALTGTHGVTLALYKERQGGAPIWQETQNVDLDSQGRYSVLLGATKSEGVPMDLFATDEPRWLGVQVVLPGYQEEPRVLLVSVPFALKAVEAETLNGLPLSSFVLTPEGARNAAVSGLTGVVEESKSAASLRSAAGVSGTGTTNQLTKWLDTNGTLGDSSVYENGGNVGIGTASSPAGKLDVFGTLIAGDSTNTTPDRTHTPALALRSGKTASSATSLEFIGTTNGYSAPGPSYDQGRIYGIFDGPFYFNARITIASPSSSGAFTDVLSVKNGNVGIGTITPAQRLDVSGNINASGAVAAASFVGSGASLTGLSASNLSTGTIANNLTSATSANTASAIVSRDGSGNFTAGTITASAFSGGGALLTGVNAAQLNGVTTYARTDLGNTLSGTQAINGAVSVRNGTFEQLSVDQSGNLTMLGSLSAGTGNFVTASGNDLLVGQATNGSTISNVFRVDSTGKGYFNSGTQTGGADFAESFAVLGDHRNYEPGDVMVIDPSGKRRMALSTTPYSTLVSGIYSTKPGVLATPYDIDHNGNVAKEVPLAMVGVVPCKVSAENGAIVVGDLLVTSSVPGHAMRGTNRERMLGAVVGKALEPLASGTGVIQVLVTLQ